MTPSTAECTFVLAVSPDAHRATLFNGPVGCKTAGGELGGFTIELTTSKL